MDVINGNQITTNGLAIKFIPPKFVNGKIKVEMEESDVEAEIQFWGCSLIMYAIGDYLSMNVVKNYMLQYWNFVQAPDIFYNDEGYFILKFKSDSDRDAVMVKGPYTIHNMPMRLLEWRPDFSMERDMLRALHVWVKLPQLLLYLWGEKSLEKMGSAIGTPMYTDECMKNKLMVTYARILVEVDVTQKLRETIAIKDHEGRRIQHKV